MKRQQLRPLPFVAPPTFNGIGRLSNQTQTRTALTVGKVVIVVAGEFKGLRAVVVADEGAGIITICGSGIPCMTIDQSLVIATTKTSSVTQIEALAIPELPEHLTVAAI
jgi:large subunit ribosomal protein L6e